SVTCISPSTDCAVARPVYSLQHNFWQLSPFDNGGSDSFAKVPLIGNPAHTFGFREERNNRDTCALSGTGATPTTTSYLWSVETTADHRRGSSGSAGRDGYPG